jgi:hypothetical protein
VSHLPGSSRATLAVFGDPIVGRALVLLLRGFRYEVRFLPASSSFSSIEMGSLEDISLVLVAPTPCLSAGRREDLLASLEKEAEAARVPILELVGPSSLGRMRDEEDGGTGRRLKRAVPWPCGIEELVRRIEAALSAALKRVVSTSCCEETSVARKKKDGL